MARATAEEIAADWTGEYRSQLLPGYVDYLTAACPKIARCLWLLRTTPCIGPRMSANVARLLQEVPNLAKVRNLPEAVEELAETAKVGPERARTSGGRKRTMTQSRKRLRGSAPSCEAVSSCSAIRTRGCLRR